MHQQQQQQQQQVYGYGAAPMVGYGGAYNVAAGERIR